MTYKLIHLFNYILIIKYNDFETFIFNQKFNKKFAEFIT